MTSLRISQTKLTPVSWINQTFFFFFLNHLAPALTIVPTPFTSFFPCLTEVANEYRRFGSLSRSSLTSPWIKCVVSRGLPHLFIWSLVTLSPIRYHYVSKLVPPSKVWDSWEPGGRVVKSLSPQAPCLPGG